MSTSIRKVVSNLLSSITEKLFPIVKILVVLLLNLIECCGDKSSNAFDCVFNELTLFIKSASPIFKGKLCSDLISLN